MSGAEASIVHTGGCQCGAVRFSLSDFARPSICYCRMCQKAFGNIGAPLVTAIGLSWTRGQPAHFQSSSTSRRGFCKECGTPLTFESNGEVELAICALDDPAAVAPAYAVGTDAKIPWTDALATLPGRPAEDEAAAANRLANIVNRQHPDHETAVWPTHNTGSRP